MPEPPGRRELPLPLMTRQEGIAGLAAELGVAEPVRDDIAGSWTQRRQFSVYDTDPGGPAQVAPFSCRKGGPYQVAQPPKSGPYQLAHDNGRSTIQVSERVGTQIAMISTRSPKAAKSPGFRV